MDELKKVLLFGVGAVASTYEKAVDVVDELVSKGRLTVDEGKELGTELKRTFKEKVECNDIKMKQDKSCEKSMSDISLDPCNYVLRDEYEILKARVYKLEQHVSEDKK